MKPSPSLALTVVASRMSAARAAVWEFLNPVHPEPADFIWKAVLALGLMCGAYFLLAPFAERGELMAKANADLAERRNAAVCERATVAMMARDPAVRDFKQLSRTCHPDEAVVDELKPIAIGYVLLLVGGLGFILAAAMLFPRF